MSEELWLLLRTLLSLAVVLALAVVVLRFGIPRLSGLKKSPGCASLEVLEVRPLDRQHRLALVEAEGERFLLAYGPGGVQRVGHWESGSSGQEREPGRPAEVPARWARSAHPVGPKAARPDQAVG